MLNNNSQKLASEIIDTRFLKLKFLTDNGAMALVGSAPNSCVAMFNDYLTFQQNRKNGDSYPGGYEFNQIFSEQAVYWLTNFETESSYNRFIARVNSGGNVIPGLFGRKVTAQYYLLAGFRNNDTISLPILADACKQVADNEISNLFIYASTGFSLVMACLNKISPIIAIAIPCIAILATYAARNLRSDYLYKQSLETEKETRTKLYNGEIPSLPFEV